MLLADAIKRLELADSVCSSSDSTGADIRAALGRHDRAPGGSSTLDGAELVRSLNDDPHGIRAEVTISETTGCSLNQATKETERASTLGAAFEMAEALSDGAITSGHVDALTRSARRARSGRQGRAPRRHEPRPKRHRTVPSPSSTLWSSGKAKALDRSDAESTYDRQRRATTLTTFTDADGMWNLRGTFGPAHRIEARQTDSRRHRIEVRRKPLRTRRHRTRFERTKHLEALALADIILDDHATTTASSRPGPPLVVVDASQSDGAGGPVVDWGISVELPRSVLADIFGASEADAVIVANGIVLHAAGRLDLGRTRRLANRAQRRALAGLYSTCGVPGCATHYDRCRLHHVVHWEHGGRTDLANLLPVCQHHHTRLHEDGWKVALGPNRELMIELPDGQVMRTGPPRRGSP